MARIAPLQDHELNEQAAEVLTRIRRDWGASWNITSAMAHNPAVLEGFLALWNAIDQSGLSSADREVICMEMAVANGCHYCVPAHRYAARQVGVDAGLIDRIAGGETLEGEERPAVVQRLVRRLVATKGQLDDAEFLAFQEAGITKPQMVAVIAEIAHCTMTNYFNRLAQTELDPFLAPYNAE